MKFIELELSGSYLVQASPIEDERGFFARAFCQDEFSEHGLLSDIKQTNISFNLKRGTVRGMHYQRAPFSEAKLLRCNAGRIHDVIIDLRKESKTYCQWLAVDLDSRKGDMLYIPEGFAHGFQTLTDNVELYYHMFEKYQPEASTGVRWDDPCFSITWPIDISSISEKDLSYKDYKHG